MKAGWCVLLASVCWIGLFACDRPSPDAVDQGEDEPRIVSLLPTATGLLEAMSMSDLLVARAAWDPLADDALPVVMTDSLSLEAIVSARPSHVILTRDSLSRHATLQDWADQGRFELVVGDYPHAEADVLAWAETLGRSFDQVDQADALKRKILTELEQVAVPPAVNTPDANRPQVLALFSVNPPMAAGPGTLIDQLIERAGGRNALSRGGLSVQLDDEGLVAADADVVLLLLPDANRETLDQQMAKWRPLELRAVRDDRVHLLNERDVLIPHANLGGMARSFASWIHPEAAAAAGIPSEWSP